MAGASRDRHRDEARPEAGIEVRSGWSGSAGRRRETVESIPTPGAMGLRDAGAAFHATMPRPGAEVVGRVFMPLVDWTPSNLRRPTSPEGPGPRFGAFGSGTRAALIRGRQGAERDRPAAPERAA